MFSRPILGTDTYRSERFYDDFDYVANSRDYEIIRKWLQSAYKMGYNEGQRLYGETE